MNNLQPTYTDFFLYKTSFFKKHKVQKSQKYELLRDHVEDYTQEFLPLNFPSANWRKYFST